MKRTAFVLILFALGAILLPSKAQGFGGSGKQARPRFATSAEPRIAAPEHRSERWVSP